MGPWKMFSSFFYSSLTLKLICKLDTFTFQFEFISLLMTEGSILTSYVLFVPILETLGEVFMGIDEYLFSTCSGYFWIVSIFMMTLVGCSALLTFSTLTRYDSSSLFNVSMIVFFHYGSYIFQASIFSLLASIFIFLSNNFYRPLLIFSYNSASYYGVMS